MRILKSNWFPVLLGIACLLVVLSELVQHGESNSIAVESNYNASTNEWTAPDINLLPDNPASDLIVYGRNLFANTAYYFGPHGKLGAISNGMNCQNCHLEAGTKAFSNCLSAVAATYPLYRPRSGTIESIEFRVNDCFKRSLNGQSIDTQSKEMKAIIAYINWLGKDVPKNIRPKGTGVQELLFPDARADSGQGRLVYISRCQSCHGMNGEGVWSADKLGYTYPPLWGNNSYNTAAGIYRLTRFAAYVKYSMPYGTASYDNPELTDKDAWNVAAFVNSQPRPQKFFPEDWPDISKKAVDYPFGPYRDGFSEQQHKYGPFKPIREAIEKAKAASNKKNAGK